MFWMIFSVVLLVVGLNLGYTQPRIRRAYQIAHYSPVYVGSYQLGDPEKPAFRLLILGDSSITGQGMEGFYDSAGGRFAAMIARDHHVTYENRSGMGKWAADIYHEQITGRWDLIVLALGTNDMLHDGDFKLFDQMMLHLAQKMKVQSKFVLIAGPGDMGRSRILPWWYRMMLRRRVEKYAKTMERAAQSVEGAYCNPLNYPKIFEKLGRDGLHLGVEGNRLFAEALWGKWMELQTEAVSESEPVSQYAKARAEMEAELETV